MRPAHIAIVVALVVGVYAGCSPIRLQRALNVNATDWTMYGGSIGRTNSTSELIQPPLERIWEYDASAGFSPYSVAVADSLLIVANLQGEVHAVRASNGKRVGTHNFGTAIYGTPVIERTRMYVALSQEDESLVSYSLLNGKVEWSVKVGDIETAPLLLERNLFVTTIKGELVCVDKQSGDIVWTFQVPARSRTRIVHSSPASDGSVVVFGCDNGELYAVEAKNGTLKWTARTGASIVATPSIESGRVYVGSLDDSFYAFDLETGRSLWNTPLGGKIYGSQAVSTTSVYVGTAGRALFCLDASTGNIVWRASSKGPFSAAPLLAGNVLYAGCIDRTLYAFDAETGELLWQYSTPGRVKSMPIARDGMLFVLSEDRSVIAFKSVHGR
jgi:outer membrane protein assembly factor BamB